MLRPVPCVAVASRSPHVARGRPAAAAALGRFQPPAVAVGAPRHDTRPAAGQEGRGGEVGVVGGGRGDARDRRARPSPRAVSHPEGQPPQQAPQADAGAVHAPHPPRPQGFGNAPSHLPVLVDIITDSKGKTSTLTIMGSLERPSFYRGFLSPVVL